MNDTAGKYAHRPLHDYLPFILTAFFAVIFIAFLYVTLSGNKVKVEKEEDKKVIEQNREINKTGTLSQEDIIKGTEWEEEE